MPVQEGSGTAGSGGMVGHLHPCLGFPLPPGTPTILPTTYYRPQTLPTTTADSKPLWKGFTMRTGAATLRSLDKLLSCKAMWDTGGGCRVGHQPRKLHKALRGGFLRPPPGSLGWMQADGTFFYFQRLNLCSNASQQATMANHLMGKITVPLFNFSNSKDTELHTEIPCCVWDGLKRRRREIGKKYNV